MTVVEGRLCPWATMIKIEGGKGRGSGHVSREEKQPFRLSYVKINRSPKIKNTFSLFVSPLLAYLYVFETNFTPKRTIL